ncbi:YbjN domain-containing protein [Saccharospirillum salsuginis]|uniref:Histidine kinase n=1 Tax=Saccharospirillum salsuginis TaxID=418750 RepID=A0A918KJL7_9GAMM|nr:YbjN domain-containing protein [Saccharospirillum salsuginis]GGX64187.1 histidine kinase [Saccharospirillum salsuginis]
MKALTRELIEDWLDELEVRHTLCPDCDGIHLMDYEEKLGVLESRVLLEDDLVMVFTELAIRPSAILPLQGSLHLINYDHPLLKVGLSLDDDDVPRLTLIAALPTQGLSGDYFAHWLPPILTATQAVLDQASQMDVLFLDEGAFDNPEGDSLH